MNNNIKKIFGIVAYPAAHSLSPVIHNAGFKALDLPFNFIKYDVAPNELEEFINALRKQTNIKIKSVEFNLNRLAGFSVSMPHKETIIPLLDKISDNATMIGAVSFVYIKDNKIIGDNLDHIGVANALKESNYFKSKSKTKKALVIGGGGAAKAAVFALQNLNITPIVFNRSLEKAKIIAEQFKVEAYSLSDLENYNEQIEIIINCTSLGLKNDLKIIPDKTFKKVKIALDAVYSKESTIFQKQAIDNNIELLTGLEWLLYQGFEAFKIWTGENAPKEIMRNALK